MTSIVKIKIVIILIILVIIGGISLVLILQGEKPEEQNEGKEQPPNQQLSLKEIMEQRVINSKGERYPKYSLEKEGEKNIIVTYYSPQYYFIPEEKEHNGGIMVFKISDDGNVKKFWESPDENITLPIPSIEVRDITGDGKSEIITMWSNGKFENLYIYSWTGSSFVSITPFGETSIISIFNARDGEIEIKDIDDDRIEEILLIRRKILGFDEELLEPITESYRETYKWNGQEYYLWKEEKIEK